MNYCLVLISGIVTVLLHPSPSPTYFLTARKIQHNNLCLLPHLPGCALVTKLSVQSSSAKIYSKSVRHKAKLVSLISTNFLSRETNSSLALPAFWGRVFSGEKSRIAYLLCLKLASKGMKQRKEWTSSYTMLCLIFGSEQ